MIGRGLFENRPELYVQGLEEVRASSSDQPLVRAPPPPPPRPPASMINASNLFEAVEDDQGVVHHPTTEVWQVEIET